MPDDPWRESTEGELDPDLTEEAGSSLDDWNDPYEERDSAPLLLRIVGAVVLLGMLLSAFGFLSRR